MFQKPFLEEVRSGSGEQVASMPRLLSATSSSSGMR